MSNGIGGQDGHPIASGAALIGQGVYSATGPDAPMGYAGTGGCVILARALPGLRLTGQGCGGGSGTAGHDIYLHLLLSLIGFVPPGRGRLFALQRSNLARSAWVQQPGSPQRAKTRKNSTTIQCHDIVLNV